MTRQVAGFCNKSVIRFIHDPVLGACPGPNRPAWKRVTRPGVGRAMAGGWLWNRHSHDRAETASVQHVGRGAPVIVLPFRPWARM